ncbi:hypothetical protein QCA50_016141 [Cerrena zonata]|uniref:Uncharacterized protein n=1 Tax=Cerrena zonata TaxID=2478898 RepID=A0AAW0FJA7_9APHY
MLDSSGLSILNAITIILDVLEIATSVTEPGSEFIYINEAVSAILICRFLIDLRNIYVSETTMDIDTASHGQATTIRFAHSFVGNAGAPLDTFSDDSEDGSSIDSGAIRYANDPFEYGLLRRDTTNLAISDAQAS